MTIYLDCNATTPMEPEVVEIVNYYMVKEYGNAGSRTHEFGTRAKQAVDKARKQVAAVVDAKPDEVIFTSGATEANNIAILGLEKYGRETGKMHIISTQIEHKAVLEPLAEMERRGFEVTLLPPTPGGWVEPDLVADALRKDTLLVSVMHVNNETGIIQPIPDICVVLQDHEAYFHVDAAQGFGKLLDPLLSSRIDFICASAHKMYGPKGVGALIARRRGYNRPLLSPIVFGGGQERGLRSGTLPVPLIAGFGLASEMCLRENDTRKERCLEIRDSILAMFKDFDAHQNGDSERCLFQTINVSLNGVDAEAAMIKLKGLAAVSNGSACTSSSYQDSHVLLAMQVSHTHISSAIRLSWDHFTLRDDWSFLQSMFS